MRSGYIIYNCKKSGEKGEILFPKQTSFDILTSAIGAPNQRIELYARHRNIFLLRRSPVSGVCVRMYI